MWAWLTVHKEARERAEHLQAWDKVVQTLMDNLDALDRVTAEVESLLNA